MGSSESVIVHPPRELRPSVRGLFDMHANLFEWVHEPTDGSHNRDEINVPRDAGTNWKKYRTDRGGSFGDDAMHSRSSYSNNAPPWSRISTHGCRLAVSFLPEGASPDEDAEGTPAEQEPAMPYRCMRITPS